MAIEPIISVSGLRGVVGETLTPEVAMSYACAFAAESPAGSIVLSRDGRATGGMLADVLRGSLMANGRPVIDAGIAATPTTGVLIRHMAAAGGIQISASHNPRPYNGLKLFGADGRVVPAGFGERVLERYREGSIDWVDHSAIGNVTAPDDPHAEHCRRVLALVDVERIREFRYPVLLDSNHGAGSLLGCRLLEALGCQVIAVGDRADGLFDHTPEPTEQNLHEVCRQVGRAHVAAGFCQDPDADRLALIDENGNYVGEEYTLAICLDHVLRHRKGPIVTNCSTSRMAEDLAERYDVPFFRSKVGEAHVADVMFQQRAVFGGEGNGGPIDPRVGYIRDSFVGMAVVLDAMAQRGRTLSQLAGELPRYEIFKTTIPLAQDQVPQALDRLENHFRGAEPDRLDGLRLDWPHRWLLVRPSNTEPIVRLIAEARTLDEARRLCQEAIGAVA